MSYKNDLAAPPGFAFPFSIHRTETVPITEGLKKNLEQEKLQPDLRKLKPGFLKIETYPDAISTVFAFPYKKDVEYLKEGSLVKRSIPVLETARFIFLPGYVLTSGKTAAIKGGLQAIVSFMNISRTNFPLSQEKLNELSEQAVVIKNMKFCNVPNAEIEQVTFAGEIEDAFNAGNLSLRDAKINHFTGVFNTPFKIRSLKFSRAGKINVLKDKRNGVGTDLLHWIIQQVCM